MHGCHGVRDALSNSSPAQLVQMRRHRALPTRVLKFRAPALRHGQCRRQMSTELEGVAALETVKVELDGHVATLTINRPKALNALNAAVVGDLHTALDALGRLAGDSTLRCLIVTGAGEKSFVAGADIAGMVGMSVEEAASYSAATHAAFEKIERLPVPVLAAVNGFALGGGCELAMSCDIIYASDRAKFGQPEVKLGLMPGFAGTVRLPRRVGIGAASEWIYSGNMYTAEDALSIGLVQRVLPADELATHVRGIANTIASMAPLAVRASKDVMTNGMRMSPDEAALSEVKVFSELFVTDDAKEGCAAFVEKRGATWKGS